MGATIHPHKGYLNTNFNVYVTGHEEEYSVYQKSVCDKCSIATGIVRPNEPHVLNIAQPGDYVISFNDSDEINIHIEDGYKFGGSTYNRRTPPGTEKRQLPEEPFPQPEAIRQG